MRRREFLAHGLAVPAVLAGGWMLRGAEPTRPGFPGMIVRMSEPENLEFPFAALQDAITPNEQFFVRSHFPVPKIDPTTWKLTVEGAVKNKLELRRDDVMKLPVRTLTATLECAGNGRVFLTPPVAGLQWGQGAVGNAEWGGVPLSAVLDLAGVQDAAVEVILEGADRGQVNADPKSPGPIAFARSIPIEKARHGSVLLAHRMNGAELPLSHGAPLRAVVGGWYGMASVKWLSRIIVVDKPFGGFWQTLDYSYWERKEGLPTIRPLQGMEVKSAIARPALGDVVEAGKEQRIFGAAWAGEVPVAKVEVSTDGGTNWTEAKLLGKPEPLAWVLWEHAWKPARPGTTRLMSRATDRDGRKQPMQRDPDRRSYMVTHVTPVAVVVR